jgi:single-strand DNA-binding protein
MGSVNEVTLVGHLGADAEVRQMSNGTSVATLSVATSERWADKGSGEMKEKTEWHRVVLFGKQAESLRPYLVKGKLIHVGGSITYRTYEKDGETKYSTEIKARRLNLLGGKVDENAGDRAPQQAPLTVEDIPF